ncbi:MAG TPA: hypothetical protein VHW47_06545, partial [Acidimicrobiales bacterium]|nr:hypothetical protein [Acidimicrobiales bacterium]
RLAEVRDGWINLLPGVPEEEADEQPSPSFFSSLFGSAQLPVTMCTWMPPRGGRHVGDEFSVGVMHPRGRHAVTQLRDLGVAVPGGWRVRQDHARRGLVVMVPAVVAITTVLDWTLRAGAALAMTELTGSWKARIFLPGRAGT